MKRKPFIIQLAIGIILIGIGLIIKLDYYSTLIFAMGCGLASGSIAQMVRIAYWQSPEHQVKYREKEREAHINSVDERKQYLRMKAGYITYQIITCALLILAFVLALFRVEAWVITMVFLLFILQWLLGVIVYRNLEKRM